MKICIFYYKKGGGVKMRTFQKKEERKSSSITSSRFGIVSQQLINTPTMQQKAKHQASLFGDAIIQPKTNDTGLPDNLKSGIESLSGVDMSDVKVHYNSSKPAQLNAFAFAQGSDIHLASGQEKHLPHEAWHVVQQKQGRVKPTKQLKSNTVINDDPQLEREATIMGAKALQMRKKQESKNSYNLHSPIQYKYKTNTIQRINWKFWKKWSKNDKYHKLENENTKNDTIIKKLKEYALLIQNRWILHKNYKRFKKDLQGNFKNKFDLLFNTLSKILSLVEKLDASGTTATIKKILDLLRTIESIAGEFIKLKNKQLKEELTPLLEKQEIDFGNIKDMGKEFKDIYNKTRGVIKVLT